MPLRKFALHFALLASAALLGCTNSQPSFHQNSGAPELSPNAITITNLDASVNVTGNCEALGKLEGGFEISLDGKWTAKSASCTNNTFSIRVDSLGRQMGFHDHKRETKSLLVRRTTALGKAVESPVSVQFLPDVLPGAFAEGGGVAHDLVLAKYILRASLRSYQKEPNELVSSNLKYHVRMGKDP